MNQDQAEIVVATIEAYYAEVPESKAFLFRAALMEHEFDAVLEGVHQLARASKWAPTLAEILVAMREVQRGRATNTPELPDVTWTQEEETAARDAALASYAEFRTSHPEHYHLVDERLGTGAQPEPGGESTDEESKGGDMTAETIRKPSVPSRDAADETEAPTP